MSHSVTVTMIADQFINIMGVEVNVHDIQSIIVSEDGTIIGFTPKP